MTKGLKIIIAILFLFVFISLGLNIYLIVQLQELQLQAKVAARNYGVPLQTSLRQTIEDLETLKDSTLEFEVEINQDVPIKTEIFIDKLFEFPIQATVPISQNVQTRIFVDPVGMGVQVPVDITVPLNLEIPIDTTVTLPLNQNIPVDTNIPLNLTLPIPIHINQTELTIYIDRLQGGLTALDMFFTQILEEVEDQ